MSIEEELRDSFHAQVETAPLVRDLADRSLRRAAKVRRAQAAVSIAVVALIASGVTLRLAPSRNGDHGVAETPSESTAASSTVPSTSTSPSPAEPTVANSLPPASGLDAWPRGPGPKVPFLLDGRLVHPSGGSTTVLSELQRPVATKERIVAMVGPGIQVIDAAGSSKVVVTEKLPILGFAVDATRLAYGVQVLKGGKYTSNLRLVDINSGKVLQRLDGVPQARPVGFAGDVVVLGVGDGAEGSSGSWLLATNSFNAWPHSLNDVPQDSVGNVALVSEQDASCIGVVDVNPYHHRFTRCAGGESPSYGDRFSTLSPDGKRYAGTRESFEGVDPGLDPEAWASRAINNWPVIGDAATGATDDRFRSVFKEAELRLASEQDPDNLVVWEDASHILADAQDRIGREVILRCEVDTGACEVAFDTATLSSVENARLTLVRPIR